MGVVALDGLTLTLKAYTTRLPLVGPLMVTPVKGTAHEGA